jgi:hypothetical protein
METKQTAIEWIQDKLPSIFINDDNGFYRKLFEQAKAMEKEQIMDDYMAGSWAWSEHINNGKHKKDPAEYYNETYKK